MWEDLPDDWVFHLIVEYFNPQDLKKFCRTVQHPICRYPELWRTVYRRDFSLEATTNYYTAYQEAVKETSENPLYWALLKYPRLLASALQLDPRPTIRRVLRENDVQNFLRLLSLIPRDNGGWIPILEEMGSFGTIEMFQKVYQRFAGEINSYLVVTPDAAAAAGNTDLLIYLLVHVTNGWIYALAQAARYGQLETVERMIYSHHFTTQDVYPSLLAAVQKGQVNMVRYLLREFPDLLHFRLTNLLMEAVKRRQYSMVEFLLSQPMHFTGEELMQTYYNLPSEYIALKERILQLTKIVLQP